MHSGKLPEYAGIMATFHAMCNDEKKLAMTLHYIQDHRIDSGDIIDIIYIDNQHSFFMNLILLYKKAAVMLLNYIKKILSGENIKSYPQDLSKRSYYTIPSEQEFSIFYRKYNYITKEDIEYLLRIKHPYRLKLPS